MGYESRENHSTSLDVPSTIRQEDVQVQWQGSTVTIAIPKPTPPNPKKRETPRHTLVPLDGRPVMKMALPADSDHSVDIQVKGKHLIVSVEVETTHEDGSSSYSRSMRSVPVPDGVTASDVESHVEDNQLIIAFKQPKLSDEPESPAKSDDYNNKHSENDDGTEPSGLD